MPVRWNIREASLPDGCREGREFLALADHLVRSSIGGKLCGERLKARRIPEARHSTSARVSPADLAGPEVFLANAREIGARKRAICERHGLVGVFPADEEDACDPAMPLAEQGLAISRHGTRHARL